MFIGFTFGEWLTRSNLAGAGDLIGEREELVTVIYRFPKIPFL